MLRRILLAASLMLGLVAPALAQAPPPVPALPDTERRTAYSISSSTCACAVGFAIYGDGTDVDNWVQVWIGGVRYLSTDPTFGWSLSSPTGPLSSIPRPISDAVLTFNSAQTGTVQIVGAARPRRLTQFSENVGVAARDLNQAFTTVFAELREAWDKINDVTGRVILGRPGTAFGPMPASTLCQNKILAFDATGLNPICIAQIASTVNTINREIWANDFGAVCDGATNDFSAFQNALNASNNLHVKFKGFCAVNSNLSYNNQLTFGGTNPYVDQILCQSAVTVCFTANTDGFVILHDMYVSCSPSPGSATAIVITSTNPGHTYNSGSRLDNVYTSCFTGINMANAGSWVINSSNPGANGGDSLIVNNTFCNDCGDSAIYGTTFGSQVAGGYAIHFQTGGGLSIIGDKVNVTDGLGGIYIDNQVNSSGTSDIFIVGNSIETGSAVRGGTFCIGFSRGSSGNGPMYSMMIVGNECAGWQFGVKVASDTQWMHSTTIANNSIGLGCQSSTWGYNLGAPVDGLEIIGGSIGGSCSTTPIAAVISTQTATNCIIGQWTKLSGASFGANTLSSCTALAPN